MGGLLRGFKMALEKEYKYKGITAKYWKILGAGTDVVNNKTTVRVGLYVSSESREADIKNSLMVSNFNVEGVDYTRDDLYVKIKEPIYKPVGGLEEDEQVNLNILSDAIDC